MPPTKPDNTVEYTLHPALVAFLAQANAIGAVRRAQGYEHTPVNMRENLDVMTRRFVSAPVEVEQVVDTLVPGHGADPAVPVRIYRVASAPPRPVIVFAHGGGHMAGSVSVYDGIARRVARATGHVVVSVEYRLAPECPYPAGLRDLITVLGGVYTSLERRGIGHLRALTVMGDSGGAAITASAVHAMADHAEINIAHQVLIYPSLDYSFSQASMDDLGEGYLLERERIQWLFDHYLPASTDRRAVSPLFMDIPDHYPGTLVITAGFDPLRDEGAAYVQRLRAAGHDAELEVFTDMIHAFLNLEDLVPEACARCYARIADFVNAQPLRGR
ncbi:MAG: alpha/beta hydrolase [Gammaproteobacteria bacterium]